MPRGLWLALVAGLGYIYGTWATWMVMLDDLSLAAAIGGLVAFVVIAAALGPFVAREGDDG